MDLESLLLEAGVDLDAARAKVAELSPAFVDGIPDATMDRVMDEFIQADTGRRLIRGQFRALMGVGEHVPTPVEVADA